MGRILVADDHDSLRRGLAQALGEAGHDIEEAPNGNAALEMRRMQHQIDYLRHAQGDIYEFDRIIGSSGALEKVLSVVRKVARSNTTVLVRGETGTGKELIAG